MRPRVLTAPVPGLALLLIVLAGLAGCAQEVPLGATGCPCVSGWVCCPTDVCVPEGDLCPLDPWNLEDSIASPTAVALALDQGACRVTLDEGGLRTSFEIDHTPGTYRIAHHDIYGQVSPALDVIDLDESGRIRDASIGGNLLSNLRRADGRLLETTSEGTSGRLRWRHHELQDGSDLVELEDLARFAVRETARHYRDDEGRETHLDIDRRQVDGVPWSQSIATRYDERGPVERTIVTFASVDTVVQTFLYDADGRSLGMDVTYDAFSGTRHALVLTRDADGRLREREEDGADGTVLRRYRYDYDCR